MTRHRAAIAAAAVLVLAGCASAPRSGQVVAKDYDDADSGVTTSTSCHLAGKVTVCTPIVVPWSDPECYRITIDDGDRSGDWCLDAAEWESVTVGQFYEVPESSR